MVAVDTEIVVVVDIHSQKHYRIVVDAAWVHYDHTLSKYIGLMVGHFEFVGWLGVSE